MRKVLTICLSVVGVAAFADGPSIEISVTSPGHIYQYQLVPGGNVSVYPQKPQNVSGYVYDQDRWFYDNTGKPITLQPPATGGFTIPPYATHFPFQIIVQSCGQAPTSAMWSDFHKHSKLEITGKNVLESTCQGGVGHAGDGLITITPIDGYQYPIGVYTIHFNRA